MPSVTYVVRHTKQPRGGYINPRTMKEINLADDSVLNPTENISAPAMGLIVDYMSRYALTGDAAGAFQISLQGALVLDGLDYVSLGPNYVRACDLVSSIDGINPRSIAAAYQLVAYDSAFRAGPQTFVDKSDESPDAETAQNAITMIQRTIRFVDLFGPIVAKGMTFRGGYTPIVDSGDADFCTRDVLWDMKVSKRLPTKEHTLQLMMYCLMARHAGCGWAAGIESIGVWNPRMNKAWTKRLDEIDGEVIRIIERDVIGYA